jgi:predicted Zn-dependent protease with MMP-like domain
MPRQIKPEMKPPSLGEIEAMAQQTLASLPDPFPAHVKDVVVRVEDFADTATLHGLRLRSPSDLLGLYRGTPIPGKSVMYAQHHIDMIFLYRRPILEHWLRTGEPLGAVVRHVLIHEIGHHFGFSDEDMERLESED